MKFTIIGLCLLSAVTSEFNGRCTERKDICDLSNKEFKKYIQAIKKLRSAGNSKKNQVG
ncbi:hypothetical protein DSO57_1016642 [Entomophthora muscae]|uniref:Uncharacterized protein n=1 Tax=Entomophthora muscae TaxID=34485 RepID=A0ACC2U342_9FUNG|nr:hypothetical protein DSO57_1016642 [Entomophthora muscae]